jgi:hypothetical protein
MSWWGVVLEYVRDLLGLGWCHSPLMLGLNRDKSCLLRDQVSLACKSSKPLYIRRGDVSILLSKN